MLKITLALAASLLAGSASAVTLLTATLNNASENPPTTPTTSTGAPRPASFGTANFVLNDLMTSMTFSATIFNIDVTGSQTADINDNLVAAQMNRDAMMRWGSWGPGLYGGVYGSRYY